MADGQERVAAYTSDDEGFTFSTEPVDPQDPLVAGPRWRDALREIAALITSQEFVSEDDARILLIARIALGEEQKP